MAEDLNFSLPQAKQRRALSGVLVLILLLMVLGVSGANLWFLSTGGGGSAAPAERGLGADELKELAHKLTNRNMYEAAAGVWGEYLRWGGIEKEEQARVWYRMGDLLLKADKPREALGYFYRSEMVSEVKDLAGQIDEKVQECLERAGQFAALRYEIMERSSFKPPEDTAGVVVAELGPDKITAGQLDAKIEEQIDNQLQQYAAIMMPEQLNQQKEALVAQITSPQQKLQFLQAMMMEEALYREALARKLDEDEKVRQQMRRRRQQFLAQKLLEQEVEPKINVTDSDMRTYYQANEASYVTPARARLSHIQLAEEAQARQVLERLNKGEEFAALAGELSQDEATKAKGGEIEMEISPGFYVPGIGRSAALDEKVFGSEAGAVLEEPFEGENGWHVILVRSVTAEQQKSFEEVQQEIYQTLTNQKRQELQQQIAQELMDKYEIVIHQEAFQDKSGEEGKVDK